MNSPFSAEYPCPEADILNRLDDLRVSIQTHINASLLQYECSYEYDPAAGWTLEICTGNTLGTFTSAESSAACVELLRRLNPVSAEQIEEEAIYGYDIFDDLDAVLKTEQGVTALACKTSEKLAPVIENNQISCHFRSDKNTYTFRLSIALGDYEGRVLENIASVVSQMTYSVLLNRYMNQQAEIC